MTFDRLTLKVVSESRVTWATSEPILVFYVIDLGTMYATDRQTSESIIDLCPPRLAGGIKWLAATGISPGTVVRHGRRNKHLVKYTEFVLLPPKEVVFSSVPICLSVCLSVCLFAVDRITSQ